MPNAEGEEASSCSLIFVDAYIRSKLLGADIQVIKLFSSTKKKPPKKLKKRRKQDAPALEP